MNDRQTIFSDCRQYRYTLWREWDMMNTTYAMFIGLNPSTADERIDDPTIRRCIDFAQRWGYGALCMTNLFAFRATKPAVMKAQQYPDPIGIYNDYWLEKMSENAGTIICAWGNHGTHLNRAHRVTVMLRNSKLHCLHITEQGQPGHPLYLPADTHPIPFP